MKLTMQQKVILKNNFLRH